MMTINRTAAAMGAYAVNQPGAVRKSARSEVSFKDQFVQSSEGQSFRAMLNGLSSASDVRSDKVAYYTKAIEDGNYNVPAANIASRMIAARY